MSYRRMDVVKARGEQFVTDMQDLFPRLVGIGDRYREIQVHKEKDPELYAQQLQELRRVHGIKVRKVYRG